MRAAKGAARVPVPAPSGVVGNEALRLRCEPLANDDRELIDGRAGTRASPRRAVPAPNS
jgi:hypothetical protein